MTNVEIFLDLFTAGAKWLDEICATRNSFNASLINRFPVPDCTSAYAPFGTRCVRVGPRDGVGALASVLDSIVAWARPRSRLATRDALYKLELAYGLAGAGRRDEAARELRRIDRPGSLAFNSGMLAQAAETCVMMGDFDRAVGYIARALADSIAPAYTPALFRLDPVWDPLRARADFKRLVAQR